jgi:hypothetical protein
MVARPIPSPVAVAPFIVRVGGLPAQAVKPFSSDLGSRVCRLRNLEVDLDRERERLIEQLYAQIHNAPPEERRLFLSIKRDCFNSRSLQKYRGQAHLAAARRIDALEAIYHLEDQQTKDERDFEAAYFRQLEREFSCLTGFLEDCRFMRGIAMSSALLAKHLPRLREAGSQAPGRRDKRLMISLLRYVSRAALKLSPFGSLTSVGIGLVVPLSGAEFQIVRPGSWSERSHVSLHRSLLERLAHVLLHYPPFRESLPVTVNQTITSPAPNRFVFIRPFFWEVTPDPPYLKFVMHSRVKVDLKGPRIEWLLENLRAGNLTYSELLTTLQAEFPETSPEEQRAAIDGLIGIGFLCFVWPWEVSDPQPEARLLEFLETLADNPEMATLLPPFRTMIQTINTFATSVSPGASLDQGIDGVRAAMKAAAQLGGLDSRIGATETREWFFHEDIFLGSDLPSKAVAVLSLTQGFDLVKQLAPLARISELFSLRHDFLLTAAEIGAQRWPDRSVVDFSDVFEELYPVFRQFVQFDRASRLGGPLRAQAFNPLELANLLDLLKYRADALRKLSDCIKDEGGEYRLQDADLQQFLDSLPATYTRARDFCAFLQPVNEQGTCWVLNNLLEGAGRMSSRYTSVMDPGVREHFVSSFKSRSRYAGPWFAGELCDIFWPGGQGVNVHAYQTERVLAMPGQTLSLAPERRIVPSTLKVHFLGRGRPPYLSDEQGNVIAPVHLGALAFRYLPSLAKFLTLFGPGEIRLCTPQAKPQEYDGVEVSQRHILGRVIYRRKNWSFAVEGLRSELAGLSSSQAFAAINRWRDRHKIPDRVYLAEPIPGSGASPHLKPQYLDFGSCLFVEIFRSALERGQEKLKIFEALPDPDGLIPSEIGGRLAVEIQLDSSGFLPFDRASEQSMTHCRVGRSTLGSNLNVPALVAE